MGRAVVCMALAALAWPVLGCGDDDDGGGGEGSSNELDRLVEALEEVTTTPTTSNVSMRIESEEGASFTMSGYMESLRGRSRFQGDFEQAGQSFAMEFLQYPKVAWMRSSSLQGSLPPGKSWVRTTDPEVVGSTTLTSGQFGDLIAEAGEVEDLGRDRVEGVDARHLRAAVDASDLAAKAGRSGAAGLVQGLTGTDFEVPLDVWLGPDGKPVRLYVEIDASKQSGERVTIDMVDFAYDVPVDVEPPPAHAVTDDSVLE